MERYCVLKKASSIVVLGLLSVGQLLIQPELIRAQSVDDPLNELREFNQQMEVLWDYEGTLEQQYDEYINNLMYACAHQDQAACLELQQIDDRQWQNLENVHDQMEYCEAQDLAPDGFGGCYNPGVFTE